MQNKAHKNYESRSLYLGKKCLPTTKNPKIIHADTQICKTKCIKAISLFYYTLGKRALQSPQLVQIHGDTQLCKAKYTKL